MYEPETILDSRGVDFWENASEEERNNLLLSRKGTFDPMLDFLVAEAGMNGTPSLSSYGEIREIAGKNVLFRGLSEKEHASAFREGDYWPGRGTFGSGIYAAQAKRPTDAQNYVERYYCGGGGAILVMALAEDAVVRPYRGVVDLSDQRKEAFARHYHQILAEEEANGTSVSVQRLKMRAEGAEAIYNNLGWFMATHGIDALYRSLPNGKLRDGSYFLIVNRSKVIVAREGQE